MTTSDYLINAAFLLVVLRQRREREPDLRSFVVPLVIVFFVAQQYVHALPTAGNDLLLVGFLASVGLTMGVLCEFATHVRAGSDGVALARVGWFAGILLVVGIGARMMFAFALSHGAEPAIRSFRSPTSSARLRGRSRSSRWPCARSWRAWRSFRSGPAAKARSWDTSRRKLSARQLDDERRACVGL